MSEHTQEPLPPWISRLEVVSLIDHYIAEFPDDAQVLEYLRQAVCMGMEIHTEAARNVQ